MASSSSGSCRSFRCDKETVEDASSLVWSCCGCDVASVVVRGIGAVVPVPVATLMVLGSLTGDRPCCNVHLEGGGINVANATSADPCVPDIPGETIASITAVSIRPVSSCCPWFVFESTVSLE